MKKKVISLVTALVCVCVCAVGLAACGEDTLQYLAIYTFPNDKVELELVSQNSDAKTIEYNVFMTYGDDVGIESLEINAVYSSSNTKIVPRKTDSQSDGYEIEGTFPDNPTVGTYTVKYIYGDCEVKVNFVVGKKKVSWPDFQNYYHYWTGSVIKPELLGDSEYISYDHNYGKTEVGEYRLEIDLKDPDNCEWDAIDGNGEVVTGTRVIEWQILKATYVVDCESIVSGGERNPEFPHSVYFEYAYDGTAKEFSINEAALKDIEDKITIEIRNGVGSGELVTEIKEVGIYFLYLNVNDTDHTRIKEKSDSADGWDSVCVGVMRITE